MIIELLDNRGEILYNGILIFNIELYDILKNSANFIDELDENDL